ncbi:MAG: hypothetical protein ACI915_002851 [Gammaproteobacteria bacterium]|jgi:hypothetical protein
MVLPSAQTCKRGRAGRRFQVNFKAQPGLASEASTATVSGRWQARFARPVR